MKSDQNHKGNVNEMYTLYVGCVQHRAAATADAVSGPDVPTCDKYSLMFGVNRNGTGRLASNSHFASFISNLK